MKSKNHFLLFLLILSTVIACKSEKPKVDGEKLYRIQTKDIVRRMKADSFNLQKAIYTRMDRSALTEENKKFLNKGQYGKEYFEDGLGVIKEIRIRNQEYEDILIEIQLAAISSKPFEGMPKITIDCSLQDAFYKEVEKSMNVTGLSQQDRKGVTVRNAQAVVASIKQCGWPKEQLTTAWKVLHEAPSALQAYYYSDFVRLASETKLEVSLLAATEDKLLMSYGYPQRYGTQIVDGHLYKLSDPVKVDIRRASKGMVTLEKFLAHWGLDVTEELINM